MPRLCEVGWEEGTQLCPDTGDTLGWHILQDPWGLTQVTATPIELNLTLCKVQDGGSGGGKLISEIDR